MRNTRPPLHSCMSYCCGKKRQTNRQVTNLKTKYVDLAFISGSAMQLVKETSLISATTEMFT